MSWLKTLLSGWLESGDLQKEIRFLENELRKAKLTLEVNDIAHKKRVVNHVPIVGFDDTNFEPVDAKERAVYAARVFEFYEDVLANKLRGGIGQIRELIARPDGREPSDLVMSREQYDFFLRGMEAMCWKMDEWAKGLNAEKFTLLQEEENKE